MAKINFVPICSSCGAVISEEVDYKTITDYVETREGMLELKEKVIVPCRCRKCGETFTMISVPTKLPYNLG